ncbi:MAG: sugar-binding protein [Bacteroidota bacterium]
MKKLVTILVLLLIVVICLSSVSFAKGKRIRTMIGSTLQIPKASAAPIIDGEMDDIWFNVTAVPCLKVECSLEGRTTDSMCVRAYDDFAVTARTMWDADNFYIFINVVDDSLYAANATSPWMNDNIEIFFDGGNEKATTYDDNDLQVHWNYGETPENHPITTTSIGTWVWKTTQAGYNWEIAIPNSQLVKGGVPLFAYEADKEIGYEISVGDENSASSPQYNLHWWTNNNLTWQQPNTFGTAVLSNVEVSPTLQIPFVSNAPIIDGDMTEGEGWELAPEITNNKCEGSMETTDIYAQKGFNTDGTNSKTWKDFMVSSWTLWDADNFYVFIKVTDDSLYAANATSPWMNDNIELFFDGGNEKATTYDDNDLQVHWNYGETPESHPITTTSIGTWVWKPWHDAATQSDGYNWEIAIPHSQLVKGGVPIFDYVADKEIGYEISVGDEDNAAPSRQKNLHWWTQNNLTWQQPNTFGTAVLAVTNAIKNQDGGVVTNYRLEQNYPNPFNPSTQISYSIPKSERVKLSVYNVLGNQIATLVNETKSAGTYLVNFNGQNLASGIYFYKLEAGSKMLAKKMMLIK